MLAEAKSLLAKGIDPGEHTVAVRHAERHAETIAELVASYLERYARVRKRSAAEDERILRKDVLPRWGRRKANDITRRDVVKLLNEIVDRGAPITANRTLAIVRRMFNFAIAQAILEASPCDRVEAPSAESRRERVLSEDEIRILWPVLQKDDAPMEPNVRRILKLMLVTAQRRGEVVGLRAEEIDYEKRLWTLPAERVKNGREHLIPLSGLALQILTESAPNEAGYLFSSSFTDGPYLGQSIYHATRHLFEHRRLA